MVAPCKDCTERTVSCHATCEKYKEFQQWNEKRRETIAANRTPLINEYSFSFSPGKRRSHRR